MTLSIQTLMPAETEAVHESFAVFMQSVVLPMHLAHPADVRLDGMATGGNWGVAGRFRFRGHVWKAHMDTHYEPLLLAYYSWQYLLQESTFTEVAMERGVRLDLASDLNSVRGTEHRYLYLYRDEARG